LQGANGEKAQAWLTLGEVVAVHIDKAMIRDGVYQTALARPIVRAGRRGDYFEIKPEDMFEMVRPDWAFSSSPRSAPRACVELGDRPHRSKKAIPHDFRR
jgi:hypothetical protein